MKTNINLKTSDWKELICAIRECEKSFDKEDYRNWRSNEFSSYEDELKFLRKEAVPKLIRKISPREVEISFKCTPKKFGSCSLSIKIIGIIKLKIFSQFYDTFGGGSSGNSVIYTEQNIRETRNIISNLKLL